MFTTYKTDTLEKNTYADLLNKSNIVNYRLLRIKWAFLHLVAESAY